MALSSISALADALKIMKGIAAGLSYLHGENIAEVVIAHRYLKLELDYVAVILCVLKYQCDIALQGSGKQKYSN